MALSLAGCVHYQPTPLEAGHVQAAFEQRTLADAGLRQFIEFNVTQPLPAWPPAAWDLELLSLAAFHGHPELAAARARWAVVAAGKLTAGQRPNPTWFLGPGISSVTTTPSPWILGANFQVPIETAGKRDHRLHLAERQTQAARYGIAATAWELRFRVRRALVELWAAKETAAALAAQQAAQGELIRLQEARLAAGEASMVEVQRSRIDAERTRAAQVDAANRRAAALVRLAEAVGVPPHAVADLTLNLDSLSALPAEIPPVAARQAALLNRADVLGALADYAVSEAALRLEIARQYPDLNLNPGYTFNTANHEWRLGFSAALPVLNRNEGPIAEAEARRQEQAARFAVVQARARAEVEAALAAHANAQARLAAGITVAGQLARQEQLQQARFAAGDDSRLAVVAARVEHAAAGLAVVEARVQSQEALGQLENALQLPASMLRAVVSAAQSSP